MMSGLYSAATGIISSENSQQVISENLASLNVPGYRRTITHFGELLNQQGRGSRSVGTRVAGAKTDFSPGHLEATDRPLDVAINGDGFFTVEGPRGDLYTRKGVMYLSPEGRLVTAEGLPFKGLSEAPPDTSPAQIVITREGRVAANGRPLGELEVVDFGDREQLRTRGHIYFEAAPGARTVDTDAQVVQGSREASNVNATSELIQMITGLRHHEASQRALRTIAEAVSQHTQNR